MDGLSIERQPLSGNLLRSDRGVSSLVPREVFAREMCSVMQDVPTFSDAALFPLREQEYLNDIARFRRRRDVFTRRADEAEALDLPEVVNDEQAAGWHVLVPPNLIRKRERGKRDGALSSLIEGRGHSAFRLYISALYLSQARQPPQSRNLSRRIGQDVIRDPWVEASWYRGAGSRDARRMARNHALGRLAEVGLARQVAASSGRRASTWELTVPNAPWVTDFIRVPSGLWEGQAHAILTAGETLLWLALRGDPTGALTRWERTHLYGISDEQFYPAKRLLLATGLIHPRPTRSSNPRRGSSPPEHFDLDLTTLNPTVGRSLIKAMREIAVEADTLLAERKRSLELVRRWAERDVESRDGGGRGTDP